MFLLCLHTSVEFRRQPSGVSSLFQLWVPAVKLSSSGFHCVTLPAPITFCLCPSFHFFTAGGGPLTHSQVVPQFLHYMPLVLLKVSFCHPDILKAPHLLVPSPILTVSPLFLSWVPTLKTDLSLPFVPEIPQSPCFQSSRCVP